MPELNYLNADLDLLFQARPAVLLRDLGRKVVVVQSHPAQGGYFVCLELNRQVRPHAPVKSLERWIEVLEGLSPASRAEFDGATSRTMNLGFDLHTEDRKIAQVHLPEEFLAALARLGTSYIVTLYDAEQIPPKIARSASTILTPSCRKKKAKSARR